MLSIRSFAQPIMVLFLPLSSFAETNQMSDVSAHARLRFENIEASDGPLSGNSATLRLNTSVESRFGDSWSLLGEAQAGLQIMNDLSLVNATASRELTDINFLQINRLQAQYEVSPKLHVTIGRQYLDHLNERFLGGVRFLDNDQTFEAVRLNYVSGQGQTADVSYSSRALRQGGRFDAEFDFTGDIWNLALSTPSPIGNVSIFHQNFEAQKAGQLLSGLSGAQTTVLDVSGRYDAQSASLKWALSYGRQDQSGLSNADELDYAQAGLSLNIDQLTMSAQIEKLGANGTGQAFQTPFGTNHAFQGKADLFLKTPGFGLVDSNASLKYAFGAWGEFKKITGVVKFHDFQADNGSQSLGREWDVMLQTVFRGTSLKLEYAGYNADTFGTDRSFIWLTIGKKY